MSLSYDYPCPFPGCSKVYATNKDLELHQNKRAHWFKSSNLQSPLLPPAADIVGDGGDDEWPCKYPGCGNIYAMAADLKLHQDKRGHHVSADGKPLAAGASGGAARVEQPDTYGQMMLNAAQSGRGGRSATPFSGLSIGGRDSSLVTSLPKLEAGAVNIPGRYLSPLEIGIDLRDATQEVGEREATLHWELNGARGRWDLCLVFTTAETGSEELRQDRGKLLATLRKAGLMISKRVSNNGKRHFYLLSATQERLMLQAELMRLEMQLKDVVTGGYMPFMRKNADIFAASTMYDLFTPTERQRLVQNIIEADNYNGGANLSITTLMRDGIVDSIFPLHSPVDRARLARRWAHWRFWEWHQPQPLHQVRDYFGEEVAFYFSWLGFYNALLVPVSLIGLVTFAMQWVDKFGYSNVVYGFIVVVWAVLFLKLWKRKGYTLAFRWNVISYRASLQTRPEYTGEKELGVHSTTYDVWVPFNVDDPVLQQPFVRVVPTRYSKPSTLRLRALVSAFPITLFLGAVFVLVFTILAVRILLSELKALEDYGKSTGGFFGAIVGAGVIVTLNFVYKRMARRLNDFENHRTDLAYDDALAKKIFLFQFVNVFTSMYYLGFFKQGFGFFGLIDKEDKCFLNFGEVAALDRDDNKNIGNGCMTEVALQLGTLMLVNLVFGQIQEVARPAMKVWLKRRLAGSTAVADSSDAAALAAARPEWEQQADLNEYQGTFDEYNEIALQFAMVVVFATAFPLAPFLALLNNIVEVRTDAMKFVNSTKKPFYKAANSIGGWSMVLTSVVLFAITTNAALAAFGFLAVSHMLGDALPPGPPTSAPSSQPTPQPTAAPSASAADAQTLEESTYGPSLTPLTTLLHAIVAFFFIERVFYAFFWLVHRYVPDHPIKVLREVARQDFLKSEAADVLGEQKPRFDLTLSDDWRDFDYDSSYEEGKIAAADELTIVYNEDLSAFMDTIRRRKKPAQAANPRLSMARAKGTFATGELADAAKEAQKLNE